MATKGILYLDRGFQSLTDALIERARNLGVCFKDECVKSVVSGAVSTEQNRYIAKHVIVATPQKDAQRIVEHGAWPAASDAMNVSALDLVVKGTLKERLVLSSREGLYFSVHSKAAKLCRSDQTVVHLVGYKKQSREKLEAFFRRIEPKAHIAFARYLPNMNVQDRMPTEGGATLEVLPKVFIAGPWASETRLLCDAGVANVNEIMSHLF